MNRHYEIIPECFADTLLVETLGFECPNHQLGIGKVFGALNEKYQKRKAIAIIDNDKVKPKSVDSFVLKEEKEGIRRLEKGNHTILILCPAFEDWIFDNADKKGVDPGKFKFTTSKFFKNACKKIDARKNQNLRQFLNTLNQKQAPGFVQLKSWISEILEK